MQAADICCYYTLKSKRWRVNCIVSRTVLCFHASAHRIRPPNHVAGMLETGLEQAPQQSGSSFLSNQRWCRQRPCCCLPDTAKQGTDLGPAASYETGQGSCSLFPLHLRRCFQLQAPATQPRPHGRPAGNDDREGQLVRPPCCACITKQQPSLEAGREPELPRLRFLLRLQPPHIGTWFWQPLKLARAPAGPAAGQKDPRSATRNRTMRQATAHRHTQQMSAFGTRLAQSCEIEALLFEKTNVAEAGVWLDAWRDR